MTLIDKLEILSAAAKHDVSCSSSGSRRANAGGGLGNAARAGVCHSWSDDGRCISLLKILFTNHCIHDCAYCANRVSNPIRRAAFTPNASVQFSASVRGTDADDLIYAWDFDGDGETDLLGRSTIGPPTSMPRRGRGPSD